MRKSEIVRCGVALGAPLHLTWSCYQSQGCQGGQGGQGGEDLACGVCDSCALRLRAFAEAGVADAISYRRAMAAEG